MNVPAVTAFKTKLVLFHVMGHLQVLEQKLRWHSACTILVWFLSCYADEKMTQTEPVHVCECCLEQVNGVYVFMRQEALTDSASSQICSCACLCLFLVPGRITPPVQLNSDHDLSTSSLVYLRLSWMHTNSWGFSLLQTAISFRTAITLAGQY